MSTPTKAGRAAYDETVQASSGLVDLVRRATGRGQVVEFPMTDTLLAVDLVEPVSRR